MVYFTNVNYLCLRLNVDAAIVEVFKSKLFNDMCRRYGKDNHQDLKSEVLLMICEMPMEKKIKIVDGGYLLPYALQMLRFQGTGNKNNTFQKHFQNKKEIPYYFKVDYGPHGEKMQSNFIDTYGTHTLKVEEYDAEKAEIEEKITEKIKQDSVSQSNEFFYHSRLILESIKYKNVKKTANAIGIPYNSVRRSLSDYKKALMEWAKG